MSGTTQQPPQAADTAHDTFARDLLVALATRPRQIAPKYFYDAAGSRLFDRICELPEYYLTRTELALLQAHAPEVAARIGPQAEIIEFGAGSLHKVRLLLDALECPAGYLPIDISGAFLRGAAAALQRERPALHVQPLVADYTQPLQLPSPRGAGRRLGFFPGSTIGNLTPDAALDFLRRAASLLRGGALLLGVDLVKDPSILHAAYNDATGITAAFNRNLLVRANRELGADFVPARFAHSAFYNAPLQRIEMHLMSCQRQQVRVRGECFEFADGETLHTENSYKYTIEGVQALARRAGFAPLAAWTDPANWYSLHWLQAPAKETAA